MNDKPIPERWPEGRETRFNEIVTSSKEFTFEERERLKLCEWEDFLFYELCLAEDAKARAEESSAATDVLLRQSQAALKDAESSLVEQRIALTQQVKKQFDRANAAEAKVRELEQALQRAITPMEWSQHCPRSAGGHVLPGNGIEIANSILRSRAALHLTDKAVKNG